MRGETNVTLSESWADEFVHVVCGLCICLCINVKDSGHARTPR